MWLTTMEAVAVADGIIGICIAGGEIIREVPAQQKNLHFGIGGSLSLLHYKLMIYQNLVWLVTHCKETLTFVVVLVAYHSLLFHIFVTTVATCMGGH
jgi:hypothetical protein